jgi:ubiquinone/menaquinone biosynthesis C-methylase UbiE
MMESCLTVNAEDVPDGMTSKQCVWDEFGRWSQAKIKGSPETYMVSGFPFSNEPWAQAFTQSINSLNGKSVLDVGCGLGYFSVYAAKAGARVVAIDLQSEMLQAARMVAQINGIDCQFHRANMSRLPFADNSFDIVVGMAILHHLSKPDVLTALKEVHRVLSDGGRAVFMEPVENSMPFNFLQNILPAGRKESGYYRPSRLSTKAWARYLAKVEDRDMTNEELFHAGAPFKEVRLRAFGLLNRLDRFIKSVRLMSLVNSLDHYLFRFCPSLKRFSRDVIVEYEK